MATFFRNDLDVIHPELGEKVGAVFTERLGGVSSGPWGGKDGIMGLNVGTHVGDNVGCVCMNRNIVAQMTEDAPRWMTQVHGTTVVDAELIDTDAVEADAATSVTPGVVCVVQVADCLPVLLAETQGRGVASVHAGWRSLSAGIIEKTVARLRERLGDDAAEIKAWLGPRIGDDDFETNEATARVFTEHFGDVPGAVKPSENEGKVFLSLARYAEAALNKVGVTAIEDCGLSTVTDDVHFYSYRRDGEKTGRHAAAVWIKAAAPENK